MTAYSFISFYSILFYSVLFYSILFYSILFYLWTYKAPLAVQPNRRRFQCEGPLEKRKVLRQRAETVVPPDNITARVKAGRSFHSKGPTEAYAVLWQSETEELEGHDGQKSGEDVQR